MTEVDDRATDPRDTRRAFSLLEIVLAVVILILGLLPMLQTHVVTSETTRFNRDEVNAAALAGQVIERFKEEPVDYLRTADLTRTIAEDPFLSPWTVSQPPAVQEYVLAYKQGSSRFRREATFEPIVDDLGVAVGGTLLCRVAWSEAREGRSHEREFKVAIVVTRHHYPGGRP